MDKRSGPLPGPFERRTYRVQRGYRTVGFLFVIALIASGCLLTFLLKYPLPSGSDWRGWLEIVSLCLGMSGFCLATALPMLRTCLVLSPQGILYHGPVFTDEGVGLSYTIYSPWENIEGLASMSWKKGVIDGFHLREPALAELSLHEGIQSGQPVVKIAKRVPRFINVNRYTRFIPLSPFGGHETHLEHSQLFEELRAFVPQAFPAQGTSQ